MAPNFGVLLSFSCMLNNLLLLLLEQARFLPAWGYWPAKLPAVLY